MRIIIDFIKAHLAYRGKKKKQVASKYDVLYSRQRNNLRYVLIICLLCGVIVGLILTTHETISVATDFFEKMPEERVAKVVCRLHLEESSPTKKKGLGVKTGGGGDPRARVTKKGVMGIMSGKVQGIGSSSEDVLATAGYATGIDAILEGASGMKKGKRSSAGRKGLGGVGYGAGYGSGFGGGTGGVDNLIRDMMNGTGDGELHLDKAGRVQQEIPQDIHPVSNNDVGKSCNTELNQSITYTPASYNSDDKVVVDENPFLSVDESPVSTFSIDVDDASYVNIRHYVRHNMLPPKDAIRIEEMINYFSYDYPAPTGKEPFSVTTEVAACPWETGHRLVHIGLRGRRLAPKELPSSNFVFLVDVSGSMDAAERLPLLKESLRLLVSTLKNEDRVAIVAYGGKAGIALNSTPGSQKELVFDAINTLQAGGCTAGAEGIQLAYRIANRNYIHGGNNRIVLATDGNFNVGVSEDSALVRLIEKRRGQGIFLTVLGFGIGRDEENKMEKLANRGDGNFAYIDDISEAQRILVDERKGTFFIVGKDVKIQVKFNHEQVVAYRLIGYENRLLEEEDFADDTKDAGELGTEQTVTALYEIVPAEQKNVSTCFYSTSYSSYDTLLTLKLRYKEEKGTESRLIATKVVDNGNSLETSSDDFRFSAAVAGLGMLLLNSRHKGAMTYDAVIDLARSGLQDGSKIKRAEFIELTQRCKELSYNL